MTDGILSLLGQPTEYQRKLTAWNKARPIAGYDAGVWRIDGYNHRAKADKIDSTGLNGLLRGLL